MESKIKNARLGKRELVSYLIMASLLIASLLVIRRSGSFSDSFNILFSASITNLVLAFMCMVGVYFMAATMYYVLAYRGLRYFSTLLVAVAGAFAGKLLPAGAGGMTLNFLYLRKNKHPRAEAISIVAANNIVGMLAHGLLLLTVVLVFGGALPNTTMSPSQLILILAVIVATASALFLLRRRLNGAYKQIRIQLYRVLAIYGKQPWRIVLALLCAVLMTLCYCLCLYFAVHAVGSEISFVATISVFTIGAAAAGLAPTPSGIGAVEVGLVAGLVGFSLNTPTALAAVLLYRLVSFWLPFAIGAAALVLARRRHLI